MSRVRCASPGPRGQRGYTLIEVVVAFALLAFAMTLLLGSLTNATKQVRSSSDFGRAALHAQSLLDQAGVGEALAIGQRDGDIEGGRYHWEMNVDAVPRSRRAAWPTAGSRRAAIAAVGADHALGQGRSARNAAPAIAAPDDADRHQRRRGGAMRCDSMTADPMSRRAHRCLPRSANAIAFDTRLSSSSVNPKSFSIHLFFRVLPLNNFGLTLIRNQDLINSLLLKPLK